MRTELPVCEKCCFCVPLRYGLIGWGYISLVMSILLFIGIFFPFYGVLGIAIHQGDPDHKMYAIMLGILLICLLIDIVLSTIFVIGGHKKNLKILCVYYVYCCVVWILTTLMSIAGVIYLLVMLTVKDIDLLFHIYVLLIDLFACFGYLGIQAYVILLLRSEMIKLRSKCQFTFLNNAAESDCVMTCDEETVDGEASTEGTYQKATSMYTSRDTSDIDYVKQDNESQ